LKTQKFIERLLKHFSHKPTKEQKAVLEDLSEFISTLGSRSIFLLKGYAGTGKTTLISALVKSLPSVGKRSALLAPTGRAAKVLAKYSKRKASTLHKKIYWIRTSKNGNTFITLKENLHTNTIFIVDEASMIPEDLNDSLSKRSLLEDLIKYVYEGIDCKLILIGDTAQLPPVHLDVSPALDEENLDKKYQKQIISKELKEVVRQEKNSLVLENATQLRRLIEVNNNSLPKIKLNNDVIRISSGEDLQENIEAAYTQSGVENTTIICRSNKRANQYNNRIRSEILWQEDIISSGDILMVVRNNYFWLDEKSEAGFLANGDIIEVTRVKEIIERYGFKFAKASIKLLDYPNENEVETILLLDTISSESPSLKYEEYKKLYKEVGLDYKGQKDINKKIKENEFFNAIQIKFGYSITCHKAQGGQWKEVFIDIGYFKKEMLDKNYLRWLYTAFTRSTEKLYLIGFNSDFYKN
jgi:ATP-dependent exoDNAse (exonuclease V) alpha subunit|tara:strand:- start:1881 stop:3287 length:1407 start_codon:yes stop_codon:yes gene_type:complete